MGLIPALAAIALVLAVGIGFGAGVLGGAPAATPAIPAIVAAVPATPGATTTGAASVQPGPEASGPPADEAVAEPSAVAVASPTVTRDVAIVPVTQFRTGRSRAVLADVKGIADGSSPYDTLVLVEQDADAILAELGVKRSTLGKKLVTVATAKELAADFAAHRTRLGFLRADEVNASVRALAWGSRALFGVGRVEALDGWPLTARLEVPEGSTEAYDPAASWTLVAGGDILLDRGVSLAIQGSKAGPKFPFGGGTVAITGHCKDCSPFGWDLPYTKKTGNVGVVRDLTRGADIAIANFENPAPDKWRWHGKGMVFSANPKHIAGLVDAGIDWVSLANNRASAMRAGPGSSPRRATSTTTASSTPAPARTPRTPTRPRCSRRVASRWASWATTRSPRTTTPAPAPRAAPR